jgi:hypothetical protein
MTMLNGSEVFFKELKKSAIFCVLQGDILFDYVYRPGTITGYRKKSGFQSGIPPVPRHRTL